jgi:hypothetical protein
MLKQMGRAVTAILAAIGLLALIGCALHRRGLVRLTGVNDGPLGPTYVCTQEKSVVRRSPPNLRWSAVVFEPWAGGTWVFSSESLTGQGTLRRMFPQAAIADGAKLPAIGNYRPEEGLVEFETSGGGPTVTPIRASVRLPSGVRAAPLEIEETERAGRTNPQRSAAIFVDESGDFWTNLEWMHSCTKEAQRTMD